MGELGQAKLAVGRVQEAVKLHQDCLVGCEAFHGTGHDATLLARERLANAMHKAGMYPEAEEHYRTVVAGLEASMGKGHQRTRTIGTKLVDNLIAQAKLLEAQDVARYYRLEWSMRAPKKEAAGRPGVESGLPAGLPSSIKGYGVEPQKKEKGK